MTLKGIRVGDIVYVNSFNGKELQCYAVVTGHKPGTLLVTGLGKDPTYARRVLARDVLRHYKLMGRTRAGTAASPELTRAFNEGGFDRLNTVEQVVARLHRR